MQRLFILLKKKSFLHQNDYHAMCRHVCFSSYSFYPTADKCMYEKEMKSCKGDNSSKNIQLFIKSNGTSYSTLRCTESKL